jgi:hypothetical protein
VATVWNGDLHFENDSSALDIAAGRSAEFWREADATQLFLVRSADRRIRRLGGARQREKTIAPAPSRATCRRR